MRMRRWVYWGVLLPILIGLAAGVGVLEAGAQADARAFCGRFPVGSPFAVVAAAARDAGDPRHRMIRPNEISIAYIGMPPFSRHVCVVESESGKVAKASYVHVD